jgi:hypothetical protein
MGEVNLSRYLERRSVSSRILISFDMQVLTNRERPKAGGIDGIVDRAIKSVRVRLAEGISAGKTELRGVIHEVCEHRI